MSFLSGQAGRGFPCQFPDCRSPVYALTSGLVAAKPWVAVQPGSAR